MIYKLTDILRFRSIHKKAKLSFKGSIAEKYITRLRPSKKFIDFDLLREIVDSYNIKTEKDVICIHVRLGDLLSTNSRHNMAYARARGKLYKDTLPDIYSIVKKHKLNSLHTKCKLFYGNHTGRCEEESQEYLKNLCEQLKNLKINATIESNSADEDFVKLSTAQCLVAGQKGYGWLSASINPNEVYWDMQNPPKFDWLVKRSYLPSIVAGYKYHLKNKNDKPRT